VLVIGATPAGIAAALAAARGGGNVVLVEETSRLGGDITHAMLNMFDVPLSSAKDNDTPVASGIFGEFYRKLGVAFDIDAAEKEFEAALAAQPNLRVIKNASVKRLILEEKRLVGAVVSLAGGARKPSRLQRL
jgi:NADPH-dependent 2,4-dienoyl-CoA reductase/sulfur reductase-like enzyme